MQGNIGQVVDLAAASASASMMAKYQYDAYGNRSVISSTYTQPFGFSTKPYDAESGFVVLRVPVLLAGARAVDQP